MLRKPSPHFSSDNNKVALVDGELQLTYSELNDLTHRFASGLLNGKRDLKEERVGFFLEASVDYVYTMHGVWMAGGIAVPLNVASAINELEHYLQSASVSRVITHSGHIEFLKPLCDSLNIQLLTCDKVMANDLAALPAIDIDRRAMILFTSGTTSKPKGVVSTHKNLQAQISTLLTAWAWSENDVIPLFLPLHHIHGIVNILNCALYSGATLYLYSSFDLPKITLHVAEKIYTVFMAVPTIYVKLLQYFETTPDEDVRKVCEGFNAMRLNISGSAACPIKLFNQWQAMTGQVLLERYGMTEIGMGISNPYNGERRAGYVGEALAGVTIELFDDNNQIIRTPNTPGEIRVKGDNVFLEYWNNPQATEKSFHQGWFCTGDVAVKEDGYYRIMGRSSIDIIKSGGYKLSALEIEGLLLLNECIKEVAVIGVADETWGESVFAFIVLRDGKVLSFELLKAWCKEHMSSYKIPKGIRIVEALPRNAMGKVTKSELKKSLPYRELG